MFKLHAHMLNYTNINGTYEKIRTKNTVRMELTKNVKPYMPRLGK